MRAAPTTTWTRGLAAYLPVTMESRPVELENKNMHIICKSTIIHDGVAHSLNCRCCAGLASYELILIIDGVGLGAGSSAAYRHHPRCLGMCSRERP